MGKSSSRSWERCPKSRLPRLWNGTSDNLRAKLPRRVARKSAARLFCLDSGADENADIRDMATSKPIAQVRCTWAANELNIPYHDQEWGVPVHDEKKWFEFLILEGAQAGLSWDTILKKRARYREVFDGFDPAKVARYDKKKVRERLGDAGIIRNRLKIDAAITNARAFLEVQKEFGTFDAYAWRFVGGQPKQNAWKNHSRLP